MFSHFRNAIAWWLQGLFFFCPASLKRSMGLSPDKITIEIDEDQVIVKRYSVDSNEPLDIQRFTRTDDVQRSSVQKWLHEQQAKHILVVPGKLLLKKILSFPSAAEPDLREALGFELSRRTPFSQEQAYYDYQIIEHDKQTNKLQLEFYVVPRQNIDPLLSLLKGWNVKIDALKPVSTHPDEININLLPENQRVNENMRTDVVSASLATAVFVLLIAVLYLPLVQQTQQLDSLERDVQANRKAAIALQKSKDEKRIITDQINFLDNKHKNTLSSIELFDEITKIIPDDTWLTRLIIKNEELQIQGESSNASSLIQIVESSPQFAETQFRSPVTQNNVSGKDKFHLSAKLITISMSDPITNAIAEDGI